MSATNASLTNEITNLQKVLEAKNSTIALLEKQVDVCRQQEQRLSHKLQQVSNDYKVLEQSMQSYLTKINQSTSAFWHISRPEGETLQNRSLSLREEVEENVRRIKELTEQFSMQSVQETTQENSALQKKIDILQNKVQELQGIIFGLTQQLEQSEKTKGEEESRYIKELKMQVELQKEEIRILKGTVNDLKTHDEEKVEAGTSVLT